MGNIRVHFDAPLRFHIFDSFGRRYGTEVHWSHNLSRLCLFRSREQSAEPNEQQLGLLTKTDLAVKSSLDGGDRESISDLGSGFQIIFVYT